MKFTDLGLNAELLRAVADAGYESPTPIQQQAIPYVLMGRDVLGCAQTGTGKTAGFTLPMIEILSSGRAKARMPRSLILEPTRELAAQVAENFDAYGKYSKLTKALLIGGVSYDDQERLLDRGVDVLIATPGRLLDHFERGRILLADVKILVIDEADRMLDMGFIPDVEKIVGLLPPLRQTLFFSATMAPDVRRLADKFLSNPKEVSVAPPASTASTVVQALAMVPSDDWQKREALRRLLRAEPVKNALIFCNRKRDVDVLYKSLKKHGFNAGALHGDMDQSTRMETLDAFKRGAITFLVCSDVAARGLDIDDMSHVFNFDVPIHAEDYVHRIGRTGRAGRTGHAFTLGTYDDGKFIAAIERLIGKPIPRMTIDGMAADAAPAPDERHEKRGRGGRHGGRDRRGHRGERDSRPQRGEPRHHEAPAEAQVQAQEPQRPATVAPLPRPDQRRDAPHGRERHRERDRDDGPTPIGMGDHVPAFLLRGRRAVG
jgi:superfamily II DNA/RNA helicase